MQILSAKVLTTIVFIIFPLCYIILSITFPNYEFISNPLLPIVIVLSSVPLMLILLVFAFIPAIYSTPKFFKKRGYENVIIEYQYLKKILYISILIFIALILFYYYILKVENDLSNQGSISDLFFVLSLEMKVYYHLFFLIPSIPLSIVIKLLLEHARKEFKFYYAKGCFQIVSDKDTSQLDKANYFKTGLIWYNKFLKRNIGLYINDIMKIYIKIIADSLPIEQNEEFISISKSFDSKDGLEPLRYLSTGILGKDVGQALTGESIRTRIKESSDLLLPVIGTIITIITTFILPKP